MNRASQDNPRRKLPGRERLAGFAKTPPAAGEAPLFAAAERIVGKYRRFFEPLFSRGRVRPRRPLPAGLVFLLPWRWVLNAVQVRYHSGMESSRDISPLPGRAAPLQILQQFLFPQRSIERFSYFTRLVDRFSAYREKHEKLAKPPAVMEPVGKPGFLPLHPPGASAGAGRPASVATGEKNPAAATSAPASILPARRFPGEAGLLPRFNRIKPRPGELAQKYLRTTIYPAGEGAVKTRLSRRAAFPETVLHSAPPAGRGFRSAVRDSAAPAREADLPGAETGFAFSAPAGLTHRVTPAAPARGESPPPPGRLAADLPEIAGAASPRGNGEAIRQSKPRGISEWPGSRDGLSPETVNRLAEDVYRLIEKKLRTESERRGIFF